MHTKLFFIGLFLYLVSFIIPVDSKYMPSETYGYDIALMPFDNSDLELIDFLMVVTSITVIITCIAYASYQSKIVSIVSALGSLVAVYWVVQMLMSINISPWATLVWAMGSILITVGYELKRRRYKSVTGK